MMDTSWDDPLSRAVRAARYDELVDRLSLRLWRVTGQELESVMRLILRHADHDAALAAVWDARAIGSLHLPALALLRARCPVAASDQHAQAWQVPPRAPSGEGGAASSAFPAWLEEPAWMRDAAFAEPAFIDDGPAPEALDEWEQAALETMLLERFDDLLAREALERELIDARRHVRAASRHPGPQELACMALNRDGWCCRGCGRDGRVEPASVWEAVRTYELIPIREGGRRHVDNVITLCGACAHATGR